MSSAAAEACRLYAISAEAGSGRYDDDRYKEFVLHRLRAIPALSIFHSGGEKGWDITLTRNEGTAEVQIKHQVQLLPILGVLSSPLGEKSNGGSLEVEVSQSDRARPSWAKGGYGSYVSQWDH